ncbi:reprolysin-like metallopeptidase [Chitinophagaceae bacterium MMS25-I14]
MKKLVTLFSFLAIAGTSTVKAGVYNSIWQQLEGFTVPSSGKHLIQPGHFIPYYANIQALTAEMAGISEDPANAQIFNFPMPDGTFRSFRVWQTPVMEKGLSARYPGMYTFTAEATDNHLVTGKLDITPDGFHAMIQDGVNTVFIDPYSNINDGYYQSYYKSDLPARANPMTCEVKDDDDNPAGEPMSMGRTFSSLKYARTNGTQFKKYRLALACTGDYAIAVAGANPTKAAVLSKMVTSVNRVNSVYERELAVTMLLISNTDTLIALDTADGYTNGSGSTMLGQNQQIVTARIGSANYDIGHVFSTGGGGIASLGCVCSNNFKAQGVTGLANPVGDAFDIDYVAHEMGHQYGANHTFNANTGSCSGNTVQKDAYEPGSGSTIMAYAGICGSGDNLQQHSDPYFHATSLSEITTYITNGVGANCPTITTSPNTAANTVASFTTSYSIPRLTPFELTAPKATDATADTITYCWEEWDLGDYKQSWTGTRVAGPIFRSFLPDTARTRVFPKIAKIIAGTTSYVGEKLPDTSRSLKFKLTTRDIYQGKGCFNFGTDSITLNVVFTSAAFAVTSPSVSGVNLLGGSTQTITWNVSGTDVAPISCANVDIYLSVDGGYTYPYVVATAQPNNGSASVTLPNVTTTTKARIKVKGSGNVFFNINKYNFTITHDNTKPWPAGVSNVSLTDDVKIFPVPATDILHITSGKTGNLQVMVINTTGQAVWHGSMNEALDIPVGSWAKGVYYVRLSDESNTTSTVRSVIVR